MNALPASALSQAKARLRAEALARRRGVAADVRAAFAARLASEGQRIAVLWGASAVSAFHPIRGEPDTLPLLAALAGAGVTTALPVTVSRAEPLKFRRWRPGDPTFAGALNIAEPPPDAPAVVPDLLFTPLAAFDRRGHRIGFGAGHYDRTLKLLREQGRTLAVGVAFSVSEIETAPIEPHDQPLDLILTETELIDPKGFCW